MAIVNTIKEMFVSKKFVASVAATVVAATAKVGLDLPVEEVGAIIAPLIAYILGQGWADAGKEKAKIEKA